MSANFDRFQIGDPERDDHFIVWDEEAPFVRADESDEEPISAVQPVLVPECTPQSQRRVK